MSHEPGARLGGIRTIEDLKLRCVVDEITGCWRWTLARTDGAPKVHFVAPDGSGRRCDKGPRAALFLSRGTPVKAGHVAWANCGEADCVNPQHARSGTKTEWGAWLSRSGKVKNLASKCAGSRKAWDKRGRKITPEILAYIVRSDKSDAKLSAELGISGFAIWSARTRRSHVETMQGSSVFAWRP